MGEDLDILMYVVLFLMGAIVAIADRAASGVKCRANGKIFKFYPIRHISTALAVIFAVSAFIYYAVGGGEEVRAGTLSILGVALIFITVTFVYDMFLIFWRFNKKRGDKKSEGEQNSPKRDETATGEASEDENAKARAEGSTKTGEKRKERDEETNADET